MAQKNEQNFGFIIKKPLICRKKDKGIPNVVEKPRKLPTCVPHSHRLWLVRLKVENLPCSFFLIVTSNFVEQNKVTSHKPTPGFKWHHILFHSIPLSYTGIRESKLAKDECWEWRFRVLEKNLVCSTRVSTLMYSAGKKNR